MSHPPLVVTLELDPATTEWFDALRQAHFPPERNHLRAHVSMFHSLPGEEVVAVGEALAAAAERPAFDLDVSPPRLLGRGVAYPLVAPALVAVHAALSAAFAPWLTAQDRQPYRPHVTVQNKVDPADARALHTELSASHVPRTAGATGLLLARYLGGPWEPVASYPFTAS